MKEKLEMRSSNIIQGHIREIQKLFPNAVTEVSDENGATTLAVDFDNTKNLYIEGDNLDVLKLLRETYLCKVKMIIDIIFTELIQLHDYLLVDVSVA